MVLWNFTSLFFKIWDLYSVFYFYSNRNIYWAIGVRMFLIYVLGTSCISTFNQIDRRTLTLSGSSLKTLEIQLFDDIYILFHWFKRIVAQQVSLPAWQLKFDRELVQSFWHFYDFMIKRWFPPVVQSRFGSSPTSVFFCCLPRPVKAY